MRKIASFRHIAASMSAAEIAATWLDEEGQTKVTSGRGSRSRGAALGRCRFAGQLVAIEVAAGGDDLLELVPGSVQPHFRIGERQAEGLGNLLVVQLAEEAEREDFPMR